MGRNRFSNNDQIANHLKWLRSHLEGGGTLSQISDEKRIEHFKATKDLMDIYREQLMKAYNGERWKKTVSEKDEAQFIGLPREIGNAYSQEEFQRLSVRVNIMLEKVNQLARRGCSNYDDFRNYMEKPLGKIQSQWRTALKELSRNVKNNNLRADIPLHLTNDLIEETFNFTNSINLPHDEVLGIQDSNEKEKFKRNLLKEVKNGWHSWEPRPQGKKDPGFGILNSEQEAKLIVNGIEQEPKSLPPHSHQWFERLSDIWYTHYGHDCAYHTTEIFCGEEGYPESINYQDWPLIRGLLKHENIAKKIPLSLQTRNRISIKNQNQLDSQSMENSIHQIKTKKLRRGDDTSVVGGTPDWQELRQILEFLTLTTFEHSGKMPTYNQEKESYKLPFNNSIMHAAATLNTSETKKPAHEPAEMEALPSHITAIALSPINFHFSILRGELNTSLSKNQIKENSKDSFEDNYKWDVINVEKKDYNKYSLSKSFKDQGSFGIAARIFTAAMGGESTLLPVMLPDERSRKEVLKNLNVFEDILLGKAPILVSHVSNLRKVRRRIIKNFVGTGGVRLDGGIKSIFKRDGKKSWSADLTGEIEDFSGRIGSLIEGLYNDQKILKIKVSGIVEEKANKIMEVLNSCTHVTDETLKQHYSHRRMLVAGLFQQIMDQTIKGNSSQEMENTKIHNDTAGKKILFHVMNNSVNNDDMTYIEGFLPNSGSNGGALRKIIKDDLNTPGMLFTTLISYAGEASFDAVARDYSTLKTILGRNFKSTEKGPLEQVETTSPINHDEVLEIRPQNLSTSSANLQYYVPGYNVSNGSKISGNNKSITNPSLARN